MAIRFKDNGDIVETDSSGREIRTVKYGNESTESANTRNRSMRMASGEGEGNILPGPGEAPQTRPPGPPARSSADIINEYIRLVESGRDSQEDFERLQKEIMATGHSMDTARDMLVQAYDDAIARRNAGASSSTTDSATGEGDILPGAGQAATGAGAGTGEVDETVYDATTTTSPFDDFLYGFGIDPFDEETMNAIRPAAQQAFQSSTQSGRRQLFQNFLDQSIPFGAPGIIEDVLSTVFPQANTNFLLNQALREAPEVIASGIPGFPDINLGSSFSGFLGQPGAFGGFNQDLGQFLDLAGGNLEQLAFDNPAAFNLRDRLVNNPGLAFDFINSQVGGPVFSPFAGAASSARNRIFDRMLAQNPNSSGLDFLNQFRQGGFSALF